MHNMLTYILKNEDRYLDPHTITENKKFILNYI